MEHKKTTMTFLRTKELVQRVGLSRPTIWRLEKDGLFPKRRQLGPKAVGWLEDEVEKWMASRAVVERDHPEAQRPVKED